MSKSNIIELDNMVVRTFQWLFIQSLSYADFKEKLNTFYY